MIHAWRTVSLWRKQYLPTFQLVWIGDDVIYISTVKWRDREREKNPAARVSPPTSLLPHHFWKTASVAQVFSIFEKLFENCLCCFKFKSSTLCSRGYPLSQHSGSAAAADAHSRISHRNKISLLLKLNNQLAKSCLKTQTRQVCLSKQHIFWNSIPY